jgi:hypothetical protein
MRLVFISEEFFKNCFRRQNCGLVAPTLSHHLFNGVDYLFRRVDYLFKTVNYLFGRVADPEIKLFITNYLDR